MANINNEEPSTAPQPGRWYDLTLGPSFTDHSKFCTLRYDFKPASIDKSEPGLLHKDSNKKVTVEYNNNQPGKPKLVFEGVSEDYKENDAVLFFDGRSFRLERLHRAVKRLRHVRLPGDPAAAATLVATPPRPLAAADKGAKFHGIDDQHVPVVQMEHTVTEEDRNATIPPNPATSSSSPDAKNYEAEEKDMDTTAGGSEESVDILSVDEDDEYQATTGNRNSGSGRVLDIDINVPHQAEMEDENAEVNINDDDVEEEGKGPNAAEALKAQVGTAEDRKEDEEEDESTSSGTNSGSDSSRSEPGSSSSSSSSSSGSETTSAGGDSSSG